MEHTLMAIGKITPKHSEEASEAMKDHFFRLVEVNEITEIFPSTCWQGESIEIKHLVEVLPQPYPYQFINMLNRVLKDSEIQKLGLLGTFLAILDDGKQAEMLRVTVEGNRLYVQGTDASPQWKQKHKL